MLIIILDKILLLKILKIIIILPDIICRSQLLHFMEIVFGQIVIWHFNIFIYGWLCNLLICHVFMEEKTIIYVLLLLLKYWSYIILMMKFAWIAITTSLIIIIINLLLFTNPLKLFHIVKIILIFARRYLFWIIKWWCRAALRCIFIIIIFLQWIWLFLTT